MDLTAKLSSRAARRNPYPKSGPMPRAMAALAAFVVALVVWHGAHRGDPQPQGRGTSSVAIWSR